MTSQTLPCQKKAKNANQKDVDETNFAFSVLSGFTSPDSFFVQILQNVKKTRFLPYHLPVCFLKNRQNQSN